MEFIKSITRALEGPLPGFDAQRQMASQKFQELRARYMGPQDGYRDAAVLNLLYPVEGEWHLALMQRPESPYPHSRQISFPGGRVEVEDTSFMAAALRETEEEFGIPTTSIEVLGALSSLYIPASRFLVHPFVGYMEARPVFRPNEEVDEVLEVSVAHLMERETVKYTDVKVFTGATLRDVPYYDVQGKVVWGATAMMLSEFLEVLRMEGARV